MTISKLDRQFQPRHSMILLLYTQFFLLFYLIIQIFLPLLILIYSERLIFLKPAIRRHPLAISVAEILF